MQVNDCTFRHGADHHHSANCQRRDCFPCLIPAAICRSPPSDTFAFRKKVEPLSEELQMENEPAINIFKFAQQDVRIITKDGEPWFVAKDVCDALGLENSRKAVSSLEDDEKGVTISDTLGGKQELTTVNEPGLYSLILRSRKPEAKVFKHWVTHRVLPSIRKTGAYAIRDDKKIESSGAVSQNALEMLAKALLLAQETISKMSVPVVSATPANAPVSISTPPENKTYPSWLRNPIGCTLYNKVTGEKKHFDSLRSAVKFLGYPALSISRKQAKSIAWGDWVFTDI